MSSQSFNCPHCGEPVPLNASMCRNCGSSDEYGWNESDAIADLGDDDFDYDEFVAREFPDQVDQSPAEGKEILFRAVILAIILSFLISRLF